MQVYEGDTTDSVMKVPHYNGQPALFGQIRYESSAPVMLTAVIRALVTPLFLVTSMSPKRRRSVHLLSYHRVQPSTAMIYNSCYPSQLTEACRRETSLFVASLGFHKTR